MDGYTIKRGDSLWRIARTNGVTPSELRKANPHLWQNGRDPDLIQPGEKVAIPPTSTFSQDTNLKRGVLTCPKSNLTIIVTHVRTVLPIRGAKVSLTVGENLSTSAPGSAKTSDTKGLVTFLAIDPGTYKVVASAQG